MENDFINAEVSPEGSLDILSQVEVNKLRDASRGGLYQLFRQCCLAVLNIGNGNKDTKTVLERYKNFDVEIIQQAYGLKLGLKNAPADAFVEGKMIKGVKEHLFSVLRDIVYIHYEIKNNKNFNLRTSDGITNAVFQILRNADVLKHLFKPNLIVCWGGHSINLKEYEYTREVGYELGLRGFDVCTGCGSGAMKGPMKGAMFGHAKQRLSNSRYIGITEPGIIAAESPNPIVNDLVIMPDIEKRLEAFVRIGHGFIVFPGGVGTAEEIFYLLGILMNPANKGIPFPLILTGPQESREYFEQVDQFIRLVLGVETSNFYKIIIDDPVLIAKELKYRMEEVHRFRRNRTDAYYFNWQLKIEKDFQMPFNPTHENVAKLKIHKDLEPYELAYDLRRVFSAIVVGNVKEDGMKLIKKHGNFKINGDPKIMKALDNLLESFVAQKRMKVADDQKYKPCYEIVTK